MLRKVKSKILVILLIHSVFFLESKCDETEINALELNRMFINAEKEISKNEENVGPDELKHDIQYDSYSYRHDPFSYHQFHRNLMDVNSKTSPQALQINRAASASLSVAKKILDEKYKGYDSFKKISSMKAPKKFCPYQKNIVCDPSYPYRTLDGSCNNLKHLWWGKTEISYKRWMEPDYSDPYKLNEPRASVDGSPLPNSRDIACALHSDAYEIEPYVNNMLMQWGQFLNHDVTNLASQKGAGGPCITCKRSEKCISIPITNNYTCNCINRMNHNCIELARSAAAYPDIECSIGRREQLNLQTPFLDGSALYGTTPELASKLRSKQFKGFLATQTGAYAHKNFMPADPSLSGDDCLEATNLTQCFLGGDDRVNQNPALISLQTMFIRDHNSIASILSKMNPHWDDETVFQETRRIVIAIIQHITYNEYLPIILSEKTRIKYGLVVGKGIDYFTNYDPKIDPRIANEWASAAGRFGHSMIRSEYSRVDTKYKKVATNSLILRNSFFRSHMIYDEMQGGPESILRGLLVDPIMKVDRWFSSEVTQHLFETHDEYGRPFHFDLVAINIERAREHGVPSYVKHREYCNLEPIRTWTDMKKYIPEEIVNVFKYLYKYVDDVDVFTALVSEYKEEGSLVGPTLNCLLGIQFRDMKFGDRFWYENNGEKTAFTPGQLNEIRKVTLSKLLCRNMLDTPFIQRHAFLSAKLNYSNPMVHCTQLPGINFELWRSVY